MKESTRKRKNASKGFRQLGGDEWVRNRLYRVLADGKLAFDAMMLEMGKMFAEAIIKMDREERSGPDYHPIDPNFQKCCPALLRKTLHSTNPIESIFSMVRGCEKNVKRPRGSRMRQRRLVAILLRCEESFRRVKGYSDINEVVISIEKELSGEIDILKAA